MPGSLELQLLGRRGFNPPWAKDYIPNKVRPITGSQNSAHKTKTISSIPIITFQKKKSQKVPSKNSSIIFWEHHIQERV